MIEGLQARSILRALLIVTLVMAMVACDPDERAPADDPPQSEPANEEGTITINGQDANDHGEEDVTGAASVELEADDFYFEPTVLTGEALQEVTIHVTNEGDATHNFSIDLAQIDEDLEPGEDVEVTVAFPEVGTLVYFCSFHQSSGMLGGLEVTS